MGMQTRSVARLTMAMGVVMVAIAGCAPTGPTGSADDQTADGAGPTEPPAATSPAVDPSPTTPEGDPRAVELAGAALAFESIDRKFANPGALAQTDDGRVHALATRFNGFGGPSEIVHMVSEDGLEWELVAPVLSTDDVPYSDHTVTGSSLVRTSDGWVLYFEAVQRPSGPASIGRATAPELEGPWTVDPAPVLESGPDGAFDEDAVRDPSVLRDEDGWRMWYVGSRDTTEAIGLATSDDGITWQRRPDPVFTGAQTWDAGDVSGGRVVARDGELLMLYDNSTRGASALGLAVSGDGVSWTPLAANPVIEREDLEGTFFQFRMLDLADGDLLVLVEAGSGSATDVKQVRVRFPE